jgi:hypothetical protein
MGVTFDTNSLDRAVRPSDNPRLSEFCKINQALSAHAVEGAFSETIITIEGIKRAERAAVFGSTRLRRNPKASYRADDGTTVIPIELVAEQPARAPLDPRFAARVGAAIRIGLRMLRATRIAALYIEDPDKKLYVQDSDVDAMARRLDRFSNALRAIEARGVGYARLRRLAVEFAKRAGTVEPWYLSLGRTNDIHEERSVERAFAEWSDADSIAAHIGYGIDVFCTEDKGNTGTDPSVFDTVNRGWLEQTYGVKFATLSELAAML